MIIIKVHELNYIAQWEAVVEALRTGEEEATTFQKESLQAI